MTIHDIASAVAGSKDDNASLTAAIRVFVMGYYKMAATEEGHNRAGHGPGGSFMEELVRGQTKGMGGEDPARSKACLRLVSYR